MKLRHTLAAACALLLLGSTTASTLAYPGSPPRTTDPTVTHLNAMAVVQRYFAALNHDGLPGHDGQALDRLYAANIVLTESVITGRLQVHTGVQQVRVFDGWNELHWSVERSELLSPHVVLTIEHPSAPDPGHELDRAAPWLTLFTIRGGRIVSLIWTSF